MALWHLRHIDIGIGFSPRFFHRLEREREKMSEKRKKEREKKKRDGSTQRGRKYLQNHEDYSL